MTKLTKEDIENYLNHRNHVTKLNARIEKRIKDICGLCDLEKFRIESNGFTSYTQYDYCSEEYNEDVIPTSLLYASDEELEAYDEMERLKEKAEEEANAEKRKKDLEERELEQLRILKAKYER
jgi:hypothetical protein